MSIQQTLLSAFAPEIGLNDTKQKNPYFIPMRLNFFFALPFSQSQNSITEFSNFFACLFLLRLTSQSSIFQSCRDGATASWLLPVLSGSKVSCSRTQHDGGGF